MNTKQLLVAAGMLLLATACTNSDPIKPSYVAPKINGPAPKQLTIVQDSVYTTDGKSGSVKIRTVPESPTSPQEIYPGPRQDVMPVQVVEL